MVCHLGTLASGSGASVTIVVTVKKAGSVVNSATTTNDQGAKASASARTKVKAAGTGRKPKATTRGHKSLKATGARLLGTVNPGSQATGYFFEVGKSNKYGQLTAIKRTKTKTVKISALVRGLRAHTKYHYRLVAINGNGTSYGRDRTFRTARATHRSTRSSGSGRSARLRRPPFPAV